MQKWDKALAAYGDEFGILETVRANYLEFIEQVLKRSQSHLRVARPDQHFEIEDSGEPGQLLLEWYGPKLEGVQLLSISTWAIAPFGGTPSNGFRVGLYLSESVTGILGMPSELSAIVGLLGGQLAGLESESLDPDAHADADAEEAGYWLLAVSTLPMEIDELAPSLARTIQAFCSVAETMFQKLMHMRGSDVVQWALLCLKSLADSSPPHAQEQGMKWRTGELGKVWKDYYYLQVDRPGVGSAFLALHTESGELSLCAEGNLREDQAYLDSIGVSLDNSAEVRGKYSHFVLLDRTAAQNLFELDDTGKFQQIAQDALASAVKLFPVE